LLDDERYPNASAIKIIATATADSYLLGSRDAFDVSTTTVKEKIVKIKNSSNDVKTAEISIDGNDATIGYWNDALLAANEDILYDIEEDGDVSAVNSIGADGYALDSSDANLKIGTVNAAPFNQGKNVLKLPEITFSDEDENLGITVTIQDKYGNVVTKEDYEDIKKVYNDIDDVWEYTITNASFKLSASGIYTVTYRAKDTAGNIILKSFGIRVNDKTAPTIVIDDEDKYGVSIEVGEFFEVPLGRLIKDGQELPEDVEWTVTCSDGAECERFSTGFIPLTEGTFYVTYSGTDGIGNPQILKDDSLFYVNAEDTTDPVFNEDSSYILPPTMDWTPDEETKDMVVDIPRMEATDPIKDEGLVVSYSVTDPNGSKVTVKDYEGASAEGKEDVRYFLAEKQGVYKITYTATDSVGRSVSKSLEISIGDCEAPEITWKDNYKVTDKVNLGSEWSLDLSKLQISDNVTGSDYLNENLSIQLVNPDGTVIDSIGNEKNYKWKFDKAGEYVLTITVKDEANMSKPYKYTITVPEEEVEDKVVDSVVGTILVVISVVILAGVVVYFVVSSRKKTGVKRPSSRKKD